MIPLPVIVGFGGINAAGRSTFHHGYCRMTADALPEAAAARAYRSLQMLMGLADVTDQAELRRIIDAGTLVRRIEREHIDVDHLQWQRHFTLSGEAPLRFTCKRADLPKHLPDGWQLSALDDDHVQVLIAGAESLAVPMVYEAKVKVAGQLPSGSDPGRRYASHHHPRGLKMTVLGASDAIGSVGIDWDLIRARVNPAHIGVYAGSAMGQLDAYGNGGMIAARLAGKQATAKQCALGFAQMPADFINAYLLGNIGRTSCNLGACASFLYNLNAAVQDIQAGRTRVAVVGTSEAPITPEIIEGYAAMSALATDEGLLALDADMGATTPNHRRASRPFGHNCGFVIAESAQFIVLFDDALALELGASIHGAVNDVFIHADGYKRSISAPGIGNYITLANAVASARALLGEDAVRRRSYVQAHGSSTPQNRMTESHILDVTARAFGIERWSVAAMKCYLGHSIGSAAGDQIAAALGVWEHGVIPGIATIDGPAEDVHAANLDISAAHKQVGRGGIDVAFINAKGFGGNNASASLLAPHVVQQLLTRRHGASAMQAYAARNEAVRETAAGFENAILNGEDSPVYRFGQAVLGGENVHLDADQIRIDGYDQPIAFERGTRYTDLRD